MSTIPIETVEEDGATVVLSARDGAFVVERDGRVEVATDRQHANQAFAELALAPWQGRDDISVLVGGLGSGLLVREVLARPGVVRVDVVEASAAIVDWERRHFAALNGGASADPRVRVHRGELAAFAQAAHPDGPADGWSALLVDTDEYPGSISRPGNGRFYTGEGLAVLAEALRGGGVLGLWTTEKDDALLTTLHRGYLSAARIGAGGDQGLVYVYRARRGPRRAS